MTTIRCGLNRSALVLAFAATLALSACGSDDEPSASPGGTAAETTPAPTSEASSPAPSETAPTLTPVTRTPALDAIGVIGHSGAMGYDSEGVEEDVPANSWVTGTSSKVDSIYRRLLGHHPALRGHNWNEAVSGSSSTSLMHQAEALLTHDPVPDIVFIESIDNDMKCDGTDADNYAPFEEAVAEVVDYLQGSAPGIKIFFHTQAVNVQNYDAALLTMDGGPEHMDTNDDCSTAEDGVVDPAAEAHLQEQVDSYFAALVDLCGKVSDCATDGGALRDMQITSKDITPDMNHFSVTGLAKEAAIVWNVLPPEWKE